MKNYLFPIKRRIQKAEDTIIFGDVYHVTAETEEAAWVRLFQEHFFWLDLHQYPKIFLTGFKTLERVWEQKDQINGFSESFLRWCQTKQGTAPTPADYELDESIPHQAYTTLANIGFSSLHNIAENRIHSIDSDEDSPNNVFTVLEPIEASDTELEFVKRLIELG